MKRILFLFTPLILVAYFSTSALAHEGGHGTPEDPIASLAKVRTSQGKTFGVEGLLKANKAILSLRNASNEVVSPKASGFKDTAEGEITFRGAARATKFALKQSGNFYEGTFTGQGEEPKLKLVLTEAQGGKKQSVVIENIERVAGSEDSHGHGDGAKPHSHGSGQPHTH